MIQKLYRVLNLRSLDAVVKKKFHLKEEEHFKVVSAVNLVYHEVTILVPFLFPTAFITYLVVKVHLLCEIVSCIH